MERRAIQQEIQIAGDLPDGLVRRQLMAVAENRVALYVFRRVGPGRGTGFHLTMLAAVIGCYGLVSGLGQLVDAGPSWVEFMMRTALLSAVVLLGLVAALWASEVWRDHMADSRRDELTTAMQRLRDLEESGVAVVETETTSQS